MSTKNQTVKPSERFHLIQASKGWVLPNVWELWEYRDLLWILTLRDIKVRYKQTFLGCAWAIIQPVTNMIVFSILFGRLMKMPTQGMPYPIFVYSALVPWMFFAHALDASANSIVGSGNLITKVYFPRSVIPIAAIGSGLVDFMVSLLVVFFLMVYYGITPGFQLLAVPFLLFILILIVIGLGSFLSALVVSYRDFRYVIPFLIQLWMYATPVIYTTHLVPQKWKWLVYLNPVAPVIESFRDCFLSQPLNMGMLLISFAEAVLFLLLGINYFAQVEKKFSDVI